MDEKIISSSPLQGDAIDVIYLSSDDSDHDETNEVVNDYLMIKSIFRYYKNVL